MGGTELFTQRMKGKSKHVKAFQGAEAGRLPGAASHEATRTLAAPRTPRTRGEFEVEKHLLQFKIIRNENKIIVLVTTLHTELV